MGNFIGGGGGGDSVGCIVDRGGSVGCIVDRGGCVGCIVDRGGSVGCSVDKGGSVGCSVDKGGRVEDGRGCPTSGNSFTLIVTNPAKKASQPARLFTIKLSDYPRAQL
ncbi:hypothetical protein Pmani_037378 [Petrolisthes manimaculis]|uniref:Uncharacterized protein n=1 Tax=Petrolisthes manimaculis TaxID=1843537 RepID=A0AAE1TLH5_9EUCA|nr:hypothetical protein Pmani_037378 [Petrolisthes manimaculis]